MSDTRTRTILAVLTIGTVVQGGVTAESSTVHGGGSQGTSPAADSSECEGPDIDPWVTDFRDRVMAYDDFSLFATRTYGAPGSCEGMVTTEFDGAKFGRVILTFAQGVSLEVETMPPEVSITTLNAADGFSDTAEARALLEQAALRRGLSIDWAAPEIRTDGAEVIHQFRDPDSGINGSASLIFLDGRLVGLRLSMAP